MSQLAVVVPRPVRAYLEGLGTIGRVRPTVGGFSNTTFTTTLDGRPVVVKANSDETKRADLRREAAVLTYLADTAIPAPVLVANAHDIGDDEDRWSIVVVEAIEAEAGMSMVQRGDEIDLTHGARQIGRLLGAVHELPLSPVDVRDDVGLELSARWSTDRRAVAGLVETNTGLIHPALRVGVTLVHGDAGFHNTLWREGTLVGLIDWEFAGYGNPLADAAWVWWTMAFRRLPAAVWEAFADGYGAERLLLLGWTPEVISEFLRAQMFSLLARTLPESSARKEWLRRLDGLGRLTIPSLR
jgi:aminoglycoside phosphotransferase (APT) family kinase protein